MISFPDRKKAPETEGKPFRERENVGFSTEAAGGQGTARGIGGASSFGETQHPAGQLLGCASLTEGKKPSISSQNSQLVTSRKELLMVSSVE